MTISTIDTDSDSVIGFKISGDVTKSDYDVLNPAVSSAIDSNGSVNVLLDLTDFEWEKIEAWKSDLKFGKEFHDKIERMAIVGDKKWEKYLSDLAGGFYAQSSEFFETDDDALTWLKG